MRCFAMGLVGALLISIVAAIIVPQYADYAASAETSSWMHQLQVSKDSIAANAEQHHTLVGSGLGVQHPDFSAHRDLQFEITNDGIIFLRGGHEGQLIVLVPTLTDGKVSWRCIGGSRKATLGCNKPS